MTPEERARVVCDEYEPRMRRHPGAHLIVLEQLIAQALRDYGNDKVEKAAVIAETSDDFRSATGRRIRALKDTPQDKPGIRQ